MGIAENRRRSRSEGSAPGPGRRPLLRARRNAGRYDSPPPRRTLVRAPGTRLCEAEPSRDRGLRVALTCSCAARGDRPIGPPCVAISANSLALSRRQVWPRSPHPCGLLPQGRFDNPMQGHGQPPVQRDEIVKLAQQELNAGSLRQAP